MRKRRKLTIEIVKAEFKKSGCTLISEEYKNARTLLAYKCECGEISEITYDNFRKGVRCRNCGLQKLADRFKHDIDYVRAVFEENGCKLMTKEYQNTKQILKYECVCGNVTTTTFGNFQKGKRCKECGIKKFSETNRRTIEEVREEFRSRGCELITDHYVNTQQKLKYRCICGIESYITLSKLIGGQLCRTCGIKKNSGENHYRYIADMTEEERAKGRKILGYGSWRKEVLDRDGYRCRKCGEESASGLHVHHIFNFAEVPDLRVQKSNGIALCEICHIDFHIKYGYTGNNDEQLEEWMGTQ